MESRLGERADGRHAAVVLAQSLRLFVREALATCSMLVQAARSRADSSASTRRHPDRARRRR
jgi:hypothetical protein